MTAGSREESPRPAFLLDLDRCIGCWACAVACRSKNDLPDGIWWLYVETIGGEVRDTSAGQFPNVEKHYQPVIDRCSYVAQDLGRDPVPACAAACPTAVIQIGDAARPESVVAETIAAERATRGQPSVAGRPDVWHRLPTRRRPQRRSGGGVR